MNMMRACGRIAAQGTFDKALIPLRKLPPIMGEGGNIVAFSLADSCLLSICSSFWLVVESWSNLDHKNDD
jgi:hypothetical protein